MAVANDLSIGGIVRNLGWHVVSKIHSIWYFQPKRIGNPVHRWNLLLNKTMPGTFFTDVVMQQLVVLLCTSADGNTLCLTLYIGPSICRLDCSEIIN